MNRNINLFIAIGALAFLPYSVSAAAPKLEISGWLPYWRAASSTANVLPHLSQLKEVNPFGLSVTPEGVLVDLALNIEKSPWPEFIAAAKAKKVRVIPTVMWSDAEAMQRVLSDTFTRGQLEDQIVAQTNLYGWDGIDLDFEGKRAETRDHFSIFLKELYKKMGKKWVMCTIESRTPLDSRYDTVPKNIEYANDFKAINKYCDRVRIMTYDQQRIDLGLDRLDPAPYIPVSDPKWVEKVIKLAAKDIPLKKLVIGIPTYGYEYDVIPMDWGLSYDRLWSFNPKYATNLAQRLGLTPIRNRAGELHFSYIESFAPATAPAGIDNAPSNNPQAITTSVAPPATPWSFRIVWWSDAEAIRQKVALAKKLGVRGVAIFKLDGGEDQEMWKILK